MARWERALALLRQHVPEGERVLDLGCANGWATAKIAPSYDTYGLDASPDYIERARRRAPTAHLTLGPAEHLPYADDFFAAVVMLDVLEHVNDERAVASEISRVLRPGGLLVISVPHKGLLRWLDSHNMYAWITGEDPLSPPGASKAGYSFHRHYNLPAVAGLLGERFSIEHVHYSGLGLAELVHLPVLLLAKRWLRSKRLYRILVYGYLGAYIAEDELPLNAAGYHMMIAARRTAT